MLFVFFNTRLMLIVCKEKFVRPVGYTNFVLKDNIGRQKEERNNVQ